MTGDQILDIRQGAGPSIGAREPADSSSPPGRPSHPFDPIWSLIGSQSHTTLAPNDLIANGGSVGVFCCVLPYSRGGNSNLMHSFRRLALLLALGLPASYAALAQSPSSSSSTPAQNPAATSAQNQGQGQAQQTPQLTPGELTVQARIRARRLQRRAAAIHQTYDHLYETNLTMDFLRFTPGPSRQRVNLYGWDTAITRYYSERLGFTANARGYYGTPYVGLNFASLTLPAISVYSGLFGPTYRFYLQPKYSVSGRVMAGIAHGNFSGDTNGFGSTALGLYPNGYTYAINASLLGEYNISPGFAWRLGGDYFATGFGSSMQNSLGFTTGFVVRFGRQ